MHVCACTHTQPRPWLVCVLCLKQLQRKRDEKTTTIVTRTHERLTQQHSRRFPLNWKKCTISTNMYACVCVSVCLLVLPSNIMRVSIVYILNISLIISVYLSLSLRARLLRSKKCVLLHHSHVDSSIFRTTLLYVCVCLFCFFNVLITI